MMMLSMFLKVMMNLAVVAFGAMIVRAVMHGFVPMPELSDPTDVPARSWWMMRWLPTTRELLLFTLWGLQLWALVADVAPWLRWTMYLLWGITVIGTMIVEGPWKGVTRLLAARIAHAGVGWYIEQILPSYWDNPWGLLIMMLVGALLHGLFSFFDVVTQVAGGLVNWAVTAAGGRHVTACVGLLWSGLRRRMKATFGISFLKKIDDFMTRVSTGASETQKIIDDAPKNKASVLSPIARKIFVPFFSAFFIGASVSKHCIDRAHHFHSNNASPMTIVEETRYYEKCKTFGLAAGLGGYTRMLATEYLWDDAFAVPDAHYDSPSTSTTSSSGAIVVLGPPAPVDPATTLTIWVTGAGVPMMEVTVDAGATDVDLKEKIFAMIKLPVQSQRLVFDNTYLPVGGVLEERGIRHGSKVGLDGRVCGGANEIIDVCTPVVPEPVAADGEPMIVESDGTDDEEEQPEYGYIGDDDDEIGNTVPAYLAMTDTERLQQAQVQSARECGTLAQEINGQSSPQHDAAVAWNLQYQCDMEAVHEQSAVDKNQYVPESRLNYYGEDERCYDPDEYKECDLGDPVSKRCRNAKSPMGLTPGGDGAKNAKRRDNDDMDFSPIVVRRWNNWGDDESDVSKVLSPMLQRRLNLLDKPALGAPGPVQICGAVDPTARQLQLDAEVAANLQEEEMLLEHQAMEKDVEMEELAATAEDQQDVEMAKLVATAEDAEKAEADPGDFDDLYDYLVTDAPVGIQLGGGPGTSVTEIDQARETPNLGNREAVTEYLAENIVEVDLDPQEFRNEYRGVRRTSRASPCTKGFGPTVIVAKMSHPAGKDKSYTRLFARRVFGVEAERESTFKAYIGVPRSAEMQFEFLSSAIFCSFSPLRRTSKADHSCRKIPLIFLNFNFKFKFNFYFNFYYSFSGNPIVFRHRPRLPA